MLAGRFYTMYLSVAQTVRFAPVAGWLAAVRKVKAIKPGAPTRVEQDPYSIVSIFLGSILRDFLAYVACIERGVDIGVYNFLAEKSHTHLKLALSGSFCLIP